MPFLRQSTAQTILFGPCLDKTDGVTEETALTLAQADMRLSKDGGAFAQKSAAGNATHDSDGWYSTSLSTTDTATIGELILNVHQPANMLPVWMRWWVIEEDIYDALFAVSAAGFDTNQRVDVGMWLGTAVTLGSGAPDVNVQSQDNIDFGATQKASINTEADTALTDLQLDKLLTGAVIGANVTDNSVFAKLVSASATADWDDFVNTTDSLQAIRDVAPHGTAMRGTDSALLASSAPTNFGDLSITVTTGLVDVTQAAADKAWSTTTRVLTAAGIPSGGIAAAELNNIADALLDRRLDLGTDTGGNTTTSRTWRQALRAARNRVAIAAGTMTVYEEDDVTSVFTAAVTTAPADPIQEINPA